MRLLYFFGRFFSILFRVLFVLLVLVFIFMIFIKPRLSEESQEVVDNIKIKVINFFKGLFSKALNGIDNLISCSASNNV